MSGRDPRAVVLLSGGMDSTAALHWTRDRYGEVRAIGFDYGQPNGLLELSAARRVAAKLATPFESINLGWGVFHGQGLCAGVADHHATPAVNAAFVPGRNMLFLTLAAGRGSVWWPAGDFAVVIGANADDASGFPDCREEFFEAAGTALRRGIQRSVEIVTPFVDMTKGEILRWCSPAALDDVRRSWSCYRKAAEPCGACTACVVRAKAFADAGMEEEDRWS